MDVVVLMVQHFTGDGSQKSLWKSKGFSDVMKPTATLGLNPELAYTNDTSLKYK